MIKDPGAIRTQYGHVIDILPTTLELIGLNVPEYIRGIKQDTLQGTSLAYSFNDPVAASRHRIQYYYIFGSRSIYKDGWKAEVYHHPDFTDLTNPGSQWKSDSFLCNESCCTGYRVARRMKSTEDSGMEHLGFRCVEDD